MIKRIAKSFLLVMVFVGTAAISTYLTINVLIRSEDAVVVPQLAGKEIVHVLEVLTDLGLNTKVKGSDYSNDVPRHHVISQEPSPGDEIKKGRDVRIVISKGVRTVVLPNLIGMGASRARLLLEKNDLVQGKISHVYSDTRPKEDVLAQAPLSGTMGLRGDPVDLLVSAGSPAKVMAMVDLKGVTLNQAIETIEKLHLTTGAIRSIENVDIANHAVVEHTPVGGYPVVMGQRVDMTINRHRPGIGEMRHGEMVLFRYRTAEGFLNQQIRVILNRPAGSVEIFNAFVRPEKEIWLVIPKTEPATLLLYVDNELIKTQYYE